MVTFGRMKPSSARELVWFSLQHMCSPVERQLPHLSSHDLLSGAELTGGLTVEQAHPPIEARCGAARRSMLATSTDQAPFGAGNIEH